MTITKAKLLWAAGMFLAAWIFREKKGPEPAAATGDVELGVPTVDGVYDGPYWSKRGTVAAPDETDPTMADLIAQSNAAIAAAGGPPE